MTYQRLTRSLWQSAASLDVSGGTNEDLGPPALVEQLPSLGPAGSEIITVSMWTPTRLNEVEVVPFCVSPHLPSPVFLQGGPVEAFVCACRIYRLLVLADWMDPDLPDVQVQGSVHASCPSRVIARCPALWAGEQVWVDVSKPVRDRRIDWRCKLRVTRVAGRASINKVCYGIGPIQAVANAMRLLERSMLEVPSVQGRTGPGPK